MNTLKALMLTILMIGNASIYALDLNDSEAEWLENSPIVLFGSQNDLTPFEMKDVASNSSGLSHEYMTIIQQTLPEVEFKSASKHDWAETYGAAINKEIDVLTFVQATPELAQAFNFSQSYASSAGVLITLNHAEITQFSDLSDKSIVAVVKTSMGKIFLNQNKPNISVIEVKDSKAALSKLKQGMVDAVLLNEVHASTLALLHSQVSNFSTSSVPSYQEKFHIAVRKDWPELLSIIDKILMEIPSIYKSQINEKWVNSEHIKQMYLVNTKIEKKEKRTKFWLLLLLLPLLLIAALIGGAYYFIKKMWFAKVAHLKDKNKALEWKLSEKIIDSRNLTKALQEAREELQAKDSIQQGIDTTIKDALTGLDTRKHFNKNLLELVDIMKDQPIPMSLISVQLDKFEQYNYNHGYVAGDELTEKTANYLAQYTQGENDYLARYDSHRFVLFFIGKGKEELQNLMTKIITGFNALNVKLSKHIDHSEMVTLSIGASLIKSNAGNNVATQLLVQTEQAVSHVAEAGGNDTLFFEDLPVTSVGGLGINTVLSEARDEGFIDSDIDKEVCNLSEEVHAQIAREANEHTISEEESVDIALDLTEEFLMEEITDSDGLSNIDLQATMLMDEQETTDTEKKELHEEAKDNESLVFNVSDFELELVESDEDLSLDMSHEQADETNNVLGAKELKSNKGRVAHHIISPKREKKSADQFTFGNDGFGNDDSHF